MKGSTRRPEAENVRDQHGPLNIPPSNVTHQREPVDRTGWHIECIDGPKPRTVLLVRVLLYIIIDIQFSAGPVMLATPYFASRGEQGVHPSCVALLVATKRSMDASEKRSLVVCLQAIDSKRYEKSCGATH